MNKKIRFAVIGCGHIGKRHAEMITRDAGAELSLYVISVRKRSWGSRLTQSLSPGI